MEKFKIFECGLLYSPSGETTYTIWWSDGSITEEVRKCIVPPKPLPIHIMW